MRSTSRSVEQPQLWTIDPYAHRGIALGYSMALYPWAWCRCRMLKKTTFIAIVSSLEEVAGEKGKAVAALPPDGAAIGCGWDLSSAAKALQEVEPPPGPPGPATRSAFFD